MREKSVSVDLFGIDIVWVRRVFGFFNVVGKGISLLCDFCLSRLPFFGHLIHDDLVDFYVMSADSVVEEARRETHVDHLGVECGFVLVVEDLVSVVVDPSLLDED